jgi:hypothetical protein
LISNPIINFNATQRRDDQFNVLSDTYSPGPENFVGQFITQNTVSEFTVVGGMGFAISPHWSAGFYVEGTSHKQQFEKNYIARVLVNPPGDTLFPLSSVDFDYYVSYVEYNLKFKVGFEWDDHPNHLGLLISSPSLRVGGQAVLVSDELVSDIDVGLTSTPLSFLANTRQTGLPATWKTPLRMALGYSHEFERFLIYLSAEYFAQIGQYNIITPRTQAFIRPDTDSLKYFTPDILRLVDSRKAILNLGAGISYSLNQKINLYFSFRTDQTYYDQQRFANVDGFSPYTSTWNIYHGLIGANLRTAKYNLRVGLYCNWGKDNSYLQDVNFGNPSENNLLLGDPTHAQAKYFETGLIISYLHNF